MHSTSEQAEVEAIAKAVGFAISEWGQLEHILCSIYAATLRAPVYSVAHAAFYSIVSFQAKVKAVDVAFKLAFAKEQTLLEEWRLLRKLAQGLSEKRNGLAHGAVRVVHSTPKTVGWFPFWNGSEVSMAFHVNGELVIPPSGIARHLGSQQIGEMTADFRAAARQGEAFFQKVAQHLHSTGKQWNHDRLP